MSWVRFASKCTWTIPPNPRNDVCPDWMCPGSSVYIYESVYPDGIVCCSCSLMKYEDFVAQTRDEMLDHIEEHVRAGHHVRPSLRRESAVAPIKQ